MSVRRYTQTSIHITREQLMAMLRQNGIPVPTGSRTYNHQNPRNFPRIVEDGKEVEVLTVMWWDDEQLRLAAEDA